MLELIKEICGLLENNHIGYMLSGSVSMNVYVTPRMTRDIDIVFHLKNADPNKFLDIFCSSRYYISKPSVIEALRTRGMFNVIDNLSGYKIDFIVLKDEEFGQEEFRRKQYLKINDFYAWVVTAEDLLISKISWIQQYQSPLQMEDIKNLLRNAKLDMAYVRRWCKKLKLKTFNLL